MTQIIKKNSNKIKVHYGITDYYKYYKKNNKDCVSSIKYNKIISDFNSEIIDNILNNNLEYYIPSLGFTITVRKAKRKPRIIDGKLYNTVPVDWKTTKELWNTDEEAKEKKIIVRFNNTHTSGYVFSIRLIKFGLSFKNKKHYKFKAARDFARSLSERIKDEEKDKYDTYKLY